jgi:SH3-like domain-containing protein
VVLYARINVRANPDSTSSWVRFALKGEVLKVVNNANGWAQLADGTYVFADYIQKQA